MEDMEIIGSDGEELKKQGGARRRENVRSSYTSIYITPHRISPPVVQSKQRFKGSIVRNGRKDVSKDVFVRKI